MQDDGRSYILDELKSRPEVLRSRSKAINDNIQKYHSFIKQNLNTDPDRSIAELFALSASLANMMGRMLNEVLIATAMYSHNAAMRMDHFQDRVTAHIRRLHDLTALHSHPAPTSDAFLVRISQVVHQAIPRFVESETNIITAEYQLIAVSLLYEELTLVSAEQILDLECPENGREALLSFLEAVAGVFVDRLGVGYLKTFYDIGAAVTKILTSADTKAFEAASQAFKRERTRHARMVEWCLGTRVLIDGFLASDGQQRNPDDIMSCAQRRLTQECEAIMRGLSGRGDAQQF